MCDRLGWPLMFKYEKAGVLQEFLRSFCTFSRSELVSTNEDLIECKESKNSSDYLVDKIHCQNSKYGNGKHTKAEILKNCRSKQVRLTFRIKQKHLLLTKKHPKNILL